MTWIIPVIIFISTAHASRHLSAKKQWSHVVTIDRLAWQEREGVKKVNKLADDPTIVRRLYLDITGKIPTYDQFVSYLKDKNINKRQQLIDELLDTAGYASNFANMWGDLLRIRYDEEESKNHHEDFKKYIERVVYENKSYDSIVYDLLLAEGHVTQNGGVSFYFRDDETDPMDTLNATIKAFLGTRVGCAQCHNHRFDKWTQKEFYELAAHLWGIETSQTHFAFPARVIRTHMEKLPEQGFKYPITANMKYVLTPSRQFVEYDSSNHLTFPENYVYDNATPNEIVKERIIFDYGDHDIEGKDPRETFAKWLTSKKNPMFARVMANRLWKRVMGVAIMEPVDDWKDNIEIQNPKLFNALGEIFADVNYDFKAFLSIMLNTEAYLMAVDERNELDAENYKVQGATLKRMNAPQLRDSLLTLQYGDLDRYAKLGSQYFEFEDRLRKLAYEFHQIIVPQGISYFKSHGLEGLRKIIDQKMMNDLLTYANKVKELEAEYNIGPDGFIGGQARLANFSKTSKQTKKNNMMMNYKKADENHIIRANMVNDPEFMNVFGATDRSSPETMGSTTASIKQILKMINSEECHKVLEKDSYLMRNLYKRDKLGERVVYLYHSIFGRSPNKKEINIAVNYIGNQTKHEVWYNYTLALINSPEFYFIQ